MHSKLFNGKVEIPVETKVGVYNEEFAKFALWHAQHGRDKKLMEDLDGLNCESVEASATEEPDGGATNAATEELDDVATARPDSFLGLEHLSEKQDDVVYRRWIMGLVDHFASIRALEQVSHKLPSEAKINFSLLGLNRPSLRSGSWTAMTKEIRNICAHDSLVSRPLFPDPRRAYLLNPDFANIVHKS